MGIELCLRRGGICCWYAKQNKKEEKGKFTPIVFYLRL